MKDLNFKTGIDKSICERYLRISNYIIDNCILHFLFVMVLKQ